ncbi:MAG TPA: Gfo/Idh/MocA family oxidoreductase, partial [Pirellulales bacterium]
MSDSHRRDFLKHAGIGVAAATAASLAAVGRADETKDEKSAAKSDAGGTIVMGWIGCGGQATNLLKSFAAQPDVAVAYVCDPETARAAAAAQVAESLTGKAPQIVADMRRVLEDKSVDAVCVATPDHWHAPAAILACDAGKHVYVEKPCSHNIREGRLMVEAARRNKRVVQVGTQSRSSPSTMEAMKLLRDGAIGEILVAKAWNSQRRANIGHGAPGPQPDGLDFDLWLGPAPVVPFQANRIHYGWHWWYDFGTGDMGNDGVHDIDIARW